MQYKKKFKYNRPRRRGIKMNLQTGFDTRPPKRTLTINDFKNPETLGNPPQNVRAVYDSCFNATRTLLEHSLEGLYADGLQSFVGYGVLTGLAQNGLIRAGVEMRANEMTRKWGNIISEGDGDNQDDQRDNDKQEQIKQLEHELNRYKIKETLNKAAAFCGYFGGCLGFIDTGESDDDLATPLFLSPDTFSKNSFKGIRLIEPFLISPGIYNSVNPMKSDYYKPDLWYVQGIPVHVSRMLYFAENELPTLIRPAYNFFGLSLAQKVLDAVNHYTANRESAARLLQKYSLTVMKTDMESVLSGGLDTDLERRMNYFVQNRDNDGCAVIDKDKEDIVIMTTSLAGVTDLVRQAMEYVAAMFNEPVTKMWGISPNGFNTGDADLQNHYDNIASMQEKIFSEPMKRILNVLQMNAFGVIDNRFKFKFAPLSEDDKTEQANNNKVKADTAAVLAELGAISAEEIRQQLIDDPDSGYNSLAPYVEPTPDPLEPFNPADNPATPNFKEEVNMS